MDIVTPAKAGISWRPAETSCHEIPAFAGMTGDGCYRAIAEAVPLTLFTRRR